jgi:hypothetical protein
VKTDPRVALIIEGVRKTHTSLLWFPKEVYPSSKPACFGCLPASGSDDPIVLLEDCPYLAAAKELEDDSN